MSVRLLDTAQVVVSGVVATRFVAIVDCDVAAEQRGLGCCRVYWGAIARPGSKWRRLEAVGRGDSCWKTSREEVVVKVGGGCACVVVDDVADNSDGDVSL
jgi:hypothetical protein